MQNHWNKYGEQSFIFDVIEDGVYGEDLILEREQHYINTLNPCLNICKVVGCGPILFGEDNPMYGKTHSDYQKLKWSNNRKGTHIGVDNTFYGKTHSKESLELIGASSKKRTKYIYHFIDPNGKEYFNVKNLQDFCDGYGWSQRNIKFVLNGWINYKKWKIKRELKENFNE